MVMHGWELVGVSHKTCPQLIPTSLTVSIIQTQVESEASNELDSSLENLTAHFTQYTPD